jgi:hypothetical protein
MRVVLMSLLMIPLAVGCERIENAVNTVTNKAEKPAVDERRLPPAKRGEEIQPSQTGQEAAAQEPGQDGPGEEGGPGRSNKKIVLGKDATQAQKCADPCLFLAEQSFEEVNDNVYEWCEGVDYLVSENPNSGHLTELTHCVYAAYGHTFTDKKWKANFEQRDWYKIDPGYDEARLPKVAKENIEEIQRIIAYLARVEVVYIEDLIDAAPQRHRDAAPQRHRQWRRDCLCECKYNSRITVNTIYVYTYMSDTNNNRCGGHMGNAAESACSERKPRGGGPGNVAFGGAWQEVNCGSPY